MSNVKKNPRPPSGRPRKDVLASLKMAQLEVSKPVLPAEIMSSILDYLGPLDLIRVARTSKLMLEMVYDDSRWVQRLRKMGCWNESEARARAVRSRGVTPDGIAKPQMFEKLPIHGNGSDPGLAIKPAAEQGQSPADEQQTLSDGFDAINLSIPTSTETGISPESHNGALTALKRVQSIRGEARREYGKVFAYLAPFYNDLLASNAPSDSLVFQEYKAPEQQAQMLAQLQAFSKSDTVEGGSDRERRLLNAVDDFEAVALEEFKEGYDLEDIDGRMRNYARVLETLNGGRAVIDYFIRNNHLVTRSSELGSAADCINRSTGAASLDHTHAFLTRLYVAYNEEISIIDRAFSNPSELSILLLDKLGNDILYPFLSTLFKETRQENIGSYLKTVSGTFGQSLRFSQELQPPQGSGDDYHDAVDRLINQAFEPHLSMYLAEELTYFRKVSDSAVSEWDRALSEQAASTESFLMSNVNRRAEKNDFLTSFKKVVMMPVNIFPSFSSNKPDESKTNESGEPTADGAQKSKRSSNPLLSHPTQLQEAPTTELAAKAAIMHSKLEGIRSLFSIEVALNLVHEAKSSIERAAQFLGLGGEVGREAKQQCEAIFVALLQTLGHRHVIAGFDKAVEHLSNYKPRHQRTEEQSGVDPLVTFLELVNVGDLILQMVDVFYEQELIGSHLTDRSDFLDPAVKEKKRFEQFLDERVAAGLNKGIDVLMDEVDYILATKQLSTDFNPTASSDSIRKTVDVGPSEAAKGVVDVVSSRTQMLVGSTEKSTLDVFNQEIGLRLFAALCKHLKTQRISIDGSIKLISDMNHYFQYIQTLKNNNLLLYFTALREISQIYLIDPSDSKEMASIIADGDRFHGIFCVEEAYEFAERRADWYQVKRNVERAMYGIGCVVM
ncbi:F-box protein: endocytic membrane traffic, recycling ReCYcling 1 [Arachnomyces sp. PD_36]|nr:F-box protein: endocytic membrane traffic, recycling ReCYcling 1 [Arachnomyces sp. PD_36]